MGEVFAEAYRLRLMRGLEESLHDLGYGRIAGVDEVGRGCLAGPVTAAAVIVERGRLVPGVDDSKQLSAAKRERMARAIRQAHPLSAVVAVGPNEIDAVNILQATRLAMGRALDRLRPAPDLALIDAVRLEAPFPTLSVVRGDAISYAIACASILAKVERDRYMTELDRSYPHYGFAGHKGYGSAAHRQALAVYGPCEAHRLTFRSVVPRGPGSGRQAKKARARRSGSARSPKRRTEARSEAVAGRFPWP